MRAGRCRQTVPRRCLCSCPAHSACVHLGAFRASPTPRTRAGCGRPWHPDVGLGLASLAGAGDPHRPGRGCAAPRGGPASGHVGRRAVRWRRCCLCPLRGGGGGATGRCGRPSQSSVASAASPAFGSFASALAASAACGAQVPPVASGLQGRPRPLPAPSPPGPRLPCVLVTAVSRHSGRRIPGGVQAPAPLCPAEARALRGGRRRSRAQRGPRCVCWCRPDRGLPVQLPSSACSPLSLRASELRDLETRAPSTWVPKCGSARGSPRPWALSLSPVSLIILNTSGSGTSQNNQ